MEDAPLAPQAAPPGLTANPAETTPVIHDASNLFIMKNPLPDRLYTGSGSQCFLMAVYRPALALGPFHRWPYLVLDTNDSLILSSPVEAYRLGCLKSEAPMPEMSLAVRESLVEVVVSPPEYRLLRVRCKEILPVEIRQHIAAFLNALLEVRSISSYHTVSRYTYAKTFGFLADIRVSYVWWAK